MQQQQCPTSQKSHLLPAKKSHLHAMTEKARSKTYHHPKTYHYVLFYNKSVQNLLYYSIQHFYYSRYVTVNYRQQQITDRLQIIPDYH